MRDQKPVAASIAFASQPPRGKSVFVSRSGQMAKDVASLKAAHQRELEALQIENALLKRRLANLQFAESPAGRQQRQAHAKQMASDRPVR